MRISDWSSDVCSSDLGERCCRGARLAMYAERSAGEGCEDIPGETEHREDKGTGETRRCCPEAAEDGERLLRCRRRQEPRIGRHRIRAHLGERIHRAAQCQLIDAGVDHTPRTEAHTSELQSLMR